jgi:hypothetical protein
MVLAPIGFDVLLSHRQHVGAIMGNNSVRG